jgi:hypothetical protein
VQISKLQAYEVGTQAKIIPVNSEAWQDVPNWFYQETTELLQKVT